MTKSPRKIGNMDVRKDRWTGGRRTGVRLPGQLTDSSLANGPFGPLSRGNNLSLNPTGDGGGQKD